MQTGTTAKWKSNLVATAVAQFLCIVGWNASIPFLPLYVRDLGVTDLHQAELWSGLLAAGGAAASFLVFPFWGVLSDRMGHKWNTVRAALGIAVTFALMALVGSVQELFVARILQGALADITPAFFALTSAFVPLKSVAFALGVIQMASSAGGAVGPLVGGAVADLVGYRWAFAVSGGLSALGAVVVLCMGVIVLAATIIQPLPHRRTERLHHLGLHLPEGFLRRLHLPHNAHAPAHVDGNREREYNPNKAKAE